MIEFCNAMFGLMEDKVKSGFCAIDITLAQKGVNISMWTTRWHVCREIPALEIEKYLCPGDLARIYFEDMIGCLDMGEVK